MPIETAIVKQFVRKGGDTATDKAIKQLGNNGGGFLNSNSATTFENPTGLTNWLSIYLLLAIPFSLTYTFGKMVGSIRHGAALLAAMVIIFGVWVGGASYYEHQNNPAAAAAGVTSTVGNTVGHEVRFGDTSTAVFGVASTSTSTGSADANYDSFTPMGGFFLISGMSASRGRVLSAKMSTSPASSAVSRFPGSVITRHSTLSR